MSLTFIEADGLSLAELAPEAEVIDGVQQALDLMAEAAFQGARGLLIHEAHLPPAFFDLSTRLAGDILQKFAQYQMKLAIIGDFDKYPSKSLKAFIAESNRGSQIFFVKSKEAALEKLGAAY